MKRSEFEAAYASLLAHATKDAANVDCYACDGCQGCQQCTFCRDTKGATRCHYMVGSTDCLDCSHCQRCVGCKGCSQCVDCKNCSESAYLVMCQQVSNSNYCFGCVGLRGKEFHILNEPYDRKAYFELTLALERELGIRRR